MRSLAVLFFVALPSLAATGHHFTLQRDGAHLVVREDGRIVASAPSATAQRVVIRGTDGDCNDTLTVDLSQPFRLPGGIDFDGGKAGWDVLEVTGGAVQHEVVTQLTPNDGIFDLDGLVIRYTNLEPTSDTVPAASLTINGTAGVDTVTVSDGPGAGQATISSPSFESYTFANKTNVIFDGLSPGFTGGDTVTLNNPTPATGLVNFQIRNVHDVSATAPVNYSQFGADVFAGISLNTTLNDVNNLEARTQAGSIQFLEADDLVIGGVDASLPGLDSAGGIFVQTNGTITLADTTGRRSSAPDRASSSMPEAPPRTWS